MLRVGPNAWARRVSAFERRPRDPLRRAREEECVEQPLPEGWQELRDEAGRVYYLRGEEATYQRPGSQSARPPRPEEAAEALLAAENWLGAPLVAGPLDYTTSDARSTVWATSREKQDFLLELPCYEETRFPERVFFFVSRKLEQ